MTPDAVEMRAWWDWYGRVAETVRTREVIVRSAERALASSSEDIEQRFAIERIAKQIDTLERDAIAGERLQQRLDARPFRAIGNIVRRLGSCPRTWCS